jgi:hypothetical protein
MTSPANGEITRINPVNGLLVDADLWAAAHDFHRFHQQRHALMLHGPGVAAGLETVAHDPPNRTLIIYPGLAVDPAGNPILLRKCERFTVNIRNAGNVYVYLEFREISGGARGPAGPGVSTHLREAYRIAESQTLPEQPHIELARIWQTSGDAVLADAPDPFSPLPDQIDLRHRIEAGGRARGAIGIGHARLEAMSGDPIHRALPLRLTQALAETTGFRARFAGEVWPAEAVGQCDVLYLAGQGPLSLSAADFQGLQDFLKAGGTVLGDGCHGGSRDAFGDTFGQLAGDLGYPPTAVERGAALLRDPHLFAAPPPGSAAGDLTAGQQPEGGAMIYCGGDYGCALDGGQAGKPLDRAAIRAVLEMVINIAVAAHARRRMVAFTADRKAP